MDDGSLDDPQSGGSLRRTLEDALAENRDLKAENIGFKAKEIIAAQGFKYVTPEHLAGVALDDLATKAAEIEQAKAEERNSVLKSVLAERGIADDQIEAALGQLLQPEAAAQQAAATRVSQLNRLQGNAPGTLPDQALWGVDLIAAGIAEKTKS